MSTINQNLNSNSIRDEWLALLAQLRDTITQWVQEDKWLVDEQQKTITEDKLGTYTTCELHVRSPQGNLIVEPVARFVAGAEGRVDISAFPTLHRFLLIRKDGRWQLRTDSGVPWPKEWSRDTFLELAKHLVDPR